MEISEKILNALKAAAGSENVLTNEPMKLHTTMEVGGPADYFITPQTAQQTEQIIKILKEEGISRLVLGNGSNVICRDEGFPGAVISMTERFHGFEIVSEEEGEVLVNVKAGTLNKDFAAWTAQEGLAGFEFASGIPGSIGGATVMNAGAYDGEMKNIIRQVTLLDPEDKVITKTCEEMDFGYRHSLAGKKGFVVLETCFALKRDDPAKVSERIADLTGRREEKQPLEYPSCGSTFKRPEGFFAGKLIADTGLKGLRLGGAQVSEKHAGFIINADHATAQDILQLIELVRQKVMESQGVMLECEVKII